MNAKRKGTVANATGLFIAGGVNLWFAIARPDWKLLGVTAFCVVMGVNWLRMGRRYYR